MKTKKIVVKSLTVCLSVFIIVQFTLLAVAETVSASTMHGIQQLIESRKKNKIVVKAALINIGYSEKEASIALSELSDTELEKLAKNPDRLIRLGESDSDDDNGKDILGALLLFSCILMISNNRSNSKSSSSSNESSSKNYRDTGNPECRRAKRDYNQAVEAYNNAHRGRTNRRQEATMAHLAHGGNKKHDPLLNFIASGARQDARDYERDMDHAQGLMRDAKSRMSVWCD